MKPITKLKAALGLARGEAGTAAQIEAALHAAQDALTEAQAQLVQAEASYRAACLDPDAKITVAAQTVVNESRVAVDRAEAMVETLKARLADAREAELEAGRRAAYDKARASRDALAARLRHEYGPAAETIRSLVAALAAEAETLAIANADLPAGAEPLVSAENIVRGAGGLPEEIVGEEIVEAWAYVSTGHILDDERASQVREAANGRGVLVADSHQADVVKRRFRKISFRAARSDQSERLADALKLPDLVATDDRPIETRLEPMDLTLKAVA